MLAILYIAFLVLCLWVGYKRGVRLTKPLTDNAENALASTVEKWNAIVSKERARFAVELQDTLSSQGCLAPAQIDQRRLLDAAESYLNQSKQGNNLNLRVAAIGHSQLAYLEYKIFAYSLMVGEFGKSIQAAIEANERADKPYPVAAIQKIQELITSVKRELDVAQVEFDTAKRGREAVKHELGEVFNNTATNVAAGLRAMQRTEQPLTEAKAIAKALGISSKT
jgi:hypothetical protein